MFIIILLLNVEDTLIPTKNTLKLINIDHDINIIQSFIISKIIVFLRKLDK